MNIIKLLELYPTQEACIQHLEKTRWLFGPMCAYCSSMRVNKLLHENRYHCRDCHKSFSVTVGTIFHDTKVPLQKWFVLIALMLNAKKGLSACQAARDLDMRRPTVWSMMHRIRKGLQDDGSLLCGIVEMDETYVGGRPRKGGKKKTKKDGIASSDEDKPHPKSKRGRGTSKIPVIGMVEWGGRVRTVQATKDTLRSKDLNELIRNNIDCEYSVLMTDEYRGYDDANRLIAHGRINHSKEYANGNIHTNTIESFWAIVKRGIIGQYHKVSAKYLDYYLNEFCFRYNMRRADKQHVFAMAMTKML